VDKRLPKALFLASIASFLLSLAVPAFHAANSGYWHGFAALLFGVIQLFDGFYCWLANPLIVAVWILAAIQLKPAIMGALVALAASGACALCLTFLRHHSFCANEQGTMDAIDHVGPGFWLWLLSPGLMVFYGLVLIVQRRENWLDA
jgi:hypothetical protein